MKLTLNNETDYAITIGRGVDESTTLLLNVWQKGQDGTHSASVAQFVMNQSEARSFASWLSAMVCN